MSTMSTYILTFIMIALALVGAVILHLLLSFGKQFILKRKTEWPQGKTTRKLDEMIFRW